MHSISNTSWLRPWTACCLLHWAVSEATIHSNLTAAAISLASLGCRASLMVPMDPAYCTVYQMVPAIKNHCEAVFMQLTSCPTDFTLLLMGASIQYSVQRVQSIVTFSLRY